MRQLVILFCVILLVLFEVSHRVVLSNTRTIPDWHLFSTCVGVLVHCMSRSHVMKQKDFRPSNK